jgi:hypothetical protein
VTVKVKRGYVHIPSFDHDYDHREEYQVNQDQANRRGTLGSVLRYARDQRLGAVGLVELVEMLGLEAELGQLEAGDPKRHRRLDHARRQLGFSPDELEDRDAAVGNND